MFSVCASNSNRLIVSGGRDLTVRLWDMHNPTENRIIGTHESYAIQVCFSKSDQFVISGSTDGTIKLWDLYNPCRNKIIGMVGN